MVIKGWRLWGGCVGRLSELLAMVGVEFGSVLREWVEIGRRRREVQSRIGERF